MWNLRQAGGEGKAWCPLVWSQGWMSPGSVMSPLCWIQWCCHQQLPGAPRTNPAALLGKDLFSLRIHPTHQGLKPFLAGTTITLHWTCPTQTGDCVFLYRISQVLSSSGRYPGLQSHPGTALSAQTEDRHSLLPACHKSERNHCPKPQKLPSTI